jgi:hypothetical protein
MYKIMYSNSVFYRLPRQLLVPEFVDSYPAEGVWYFRAEKNPHCAFLRRGSKAVGPMSQIFCIWKIATTTWNSLLSAKLPILSLIEPFFHCYNPLASFAWREAIWWCKWETLKHNSVQKAYRLRDIFSCVCCRTISKNFPQPIKILFVYLFTVDLIILKYRLTQKMYCRW